jgi:hypothetical protein
MRKTYELPPKSFRGAVQGVSFSNADSAPAQKSPSKVTFSTFAYTAKLRLALVYVYFNILRCEDVDIIGSSGAALQAGHILLAEKHSCSEFHIINTVRKHILGRD